jgi:C1A family cysteine protease
MASKKKTDLDPDTDRIALPEDLRDAGTAAPPRGARRLGYLPDAPDPRDWNARAMLGAVRGLPTEASLEEYLGAQRDQGSTESCVGNALATAIEVRLRKLGYLAAARPSALAIYTYARALRRLSTDTPLADTGCFPRSAMKALREWGVPDELRWPFDVSKVNEELPWDVQQAATAFRVQGWYRIDALGRERVDAICHALAQGYPVVFGMDVDQAFLDAQGPTVLDAPHDPILGGHMLAIVGYKTVNSTRTLRIINSWGASWGDRGAFNASEHLVTAPGAGDFYVIQVGG